MNELGAKPKRRENLTSQELDREAMIYDSLNERIYILNFTAYFVWKLCDGNHTVEEITRKMCGQFPHIPEPEIVLGIKSALSEFIKNNLLC